MFLLWTLSVCVHAPDSHDPIDTSDAQTDATDKQSVQRYQLKQNFCALVIAAVLLRERNFHITFAPLSRSKCGAVEACLWVINFSWKTMREKNFRRKIQEGLIQEQKANLQYIVTMSSQPHNSLDCLFSDIASSFRCFMFRIQGCLKALFPL